MTIDELLFFKYRKHILVPAIGQSAQKKIVSSKIVIIGCGGLGCNIANNLVRAGVGFIKIIDRDFVEIGNLHRQILFDEDDVKNKIPKSVAAATKLKKINSSVDISFEIADVNASNIEEYVKNSDLILDGTDNMETRFIINNAAVKLNIPWIYGGAVSTIGMSMNIIPSKTACLNCMLNTIPGSETMPTSETSGILNTVPVMVAAIQSTEALKILINDEENINKDLIYFNLWTNSYTKIKIKVNPECEVCQKRVYV